MDALKARFRRLSTPRPNSDLQSEILDLVGWPLYVYTISTVILFSYIYLVEYHYGTTNTEDDQPFLWHFNKWVACVVWIQMMPNWACIRYADTSLKTEVNRHSVRKAKEKEVPMMHTASANTSNNHCDSNKSNGQSKLRTNGEGASTCNNHTPTQQKKQSYWSWKRCQACDLNAPPRCHHCPFCDTCVLKRDHHCFFAGRCVGFHNQRHFIVFLIWASFGTTYGMIHFFPYLYHVMLLEISAIDCFAPVAIFKLMTGYIDFFHANIIVSFTLNFFFIFLSTGFLLEQYNLVSAGVTQFEQTKVDKRKLKIVDPRPISQKLRAVLGQYPVFSLVFPWAYWVFPPKDDPFEWPSHEIKHN